MKYRVITTYNEKGGVGKSASTAHLAFSLAQFGKVLVIDGDPQGDVSKHFIDPILIQNHQKTFGSLLLDFSTFPETVLCVRPETDSFKGLYLLGTYADDRSLNQFIQTEINNKPRKIKSVIKEALISGFDYVLIDLPSLWDHYHQLVLECCDFILPTIHCETLAIGHMLNLIDKLKIHRENYEATYDLKLIIANAFDKDSAQQREYLKALNDIDFLKTLVCPISYEVAKAPINHQVVQEFKKSHSVVTFYNNLALEIHNLNAEGDK